MVFAINGLYLQPHHELLPPLRFRTDPVIYLRSIGIEGTLGGGGSYIVVRHSARVRGEEGGFRRGGRGGEVVIGGFSEARDFLSMYK
jgi:hypothetical protein